MNPQVEDPAQEVKRLQRCINDLIGLLALPAVWSGNESSQIVEMLLDALLRMLSLDFVYARLKDPLTTVPSEIFRVADSCTLKLPAQDVSGMLSNWLKSDGDHSLSLTGSQFGDGNISIFPVPLGIEGEIGLIAVGSERADFPTQTESLLLRVAANQASIGLREAQLLAEQKRIAGELDRRVAERTAELAAANGELRRTEERWRSVFENSAVGVALTNLNGQFIATNFVFQKILRYTEAELRQLTLLDITHKENVEETRTLIGELLDGKRQQFQIEKQYRCKDGQFVWVRNNVSVVPGTERTWRFLMAISEDVTQRKLSEEALAKARSELARVASITGLGVLTASIAHEINQPLSGIVTNASTCLRMLSADPPNIDGARETVRRTLRDGNRASDVITRLRTLYSKKEPSLESMDLNEAAREVAALSLSELQRSGVTLRYELSDNLPPVVGDRIQLQQVILNLLRNAADSMSTIDDRPRELLIKTERDERNHIRLSVKDLGVGFAHQTAEKIFDPFYTTKTDGMGIGLSISRSIIKAHEGRLWATPNDGPGATFSFVIPCIVERLSDGETRVDRTEPATDAA
jgi:PAS domain S-box-containing protein